MPVLFEYTYRKTRLVYEYHAFSILDFTDEELEESDNPFAVVVLVAKTALLEGKLPEQELLDRKVLVANKLFKKGFPARKVRAILAFLESYVLFDHPEMNRIFAERIKPQDKNNIMGIDEYIKLEARTEKEISVVRNLLSNTDFPNERIAAIAGVSLTFVEEVRQGKR